MLSNLFNKFAQLPPIKKLVVGTAVAGGLLLGGVTLDKAVDADWGQDSSGWTQAQKDHRHAERWREIGQGAIIILNAIQQADQQQQQSAPPTTNYPDYHPRQQQPQQQDDGGYSQQRQTRRDTPVIIPQQIPPSPRPTTVPAQEEHKAAPVVIPQTVPAPAPKKPPVDWTAKYKHVDDFNSNAAPPVMKDTPVYDNGGVVKPNNNGNWMDKYKSVTPQKPATPPAASKRSFSSTSSKKR